MHPTAANDPGTGITLRTTALRVMYGGGPAISRATGRAGKICLGARKRPLRSNFSIFELQRKIDFCDKISKFWGHGTGPWLNPAPSLQIRLAIWLYQSKALNPNTFRKIPVCQTNSQISINSSVNTARVLKRFSPGMRSITPVPALRFGLPLYESCW